MVLPRAIFALAVLTACSDHAVTRFNNEPVAAITSHADGETLNEGETLNFRGSVTDPDDSYEKLSAAWYLGDVLICASAMPAQDGATTCSAAVPLGVDTVTLEVLDEEGAAGSDAVALIVVPTQAPNALITAPTGEERLYEDVAITMKGEVNDAEDEPTALTAGWSSDLDGALQISADIGPDGAITSAGNLSQGTHVLSLTVDDTMGKSGVDRITVTVGPPNSPPECDIDEPEDGDLFAEEQVLTFVGWAGDVDEGAANLSYVWASTLEGTLSSGTAGEDGTIELESVALRLGEHTVKLTVTDEVGAQCVAEVELTIAAGPRVEIDDPSDGERFNEGTLFTVGVEVEDDDSDVEDVEVEFTSDLDGELGAGFPDADGDLSLDLSTLSVGTHTLIVSAVDPDGLEGSDSITVIINGLPTAPDIAIRPDPADTSDVLTVDINTDSTDPEGDSISYSYAWTKNGSAWSGTGATIDSADTARGQTWSVTVTPDDGYGEGAPATAELEISNAPPEITGVSISPTDPKTNDEVTATVTTDDTDGDAVTVSYAWFVEGTPVGGDSPTLDGADFFEKGEEIYVKVTPDDGSDAGAAATSSTITVANTAPGTPVVEIDPEAPRSSQDDMVCVIATQADDVDSADVLDYSFTWDVDGTTWTGSTDTTTYTGDTIPASEIEVDEVWTCTALPTDGDDDGTPASASATIMKGFGGWSSSEVSLGDADYQFIGEDTKDYAGFAVDGAGDVDGDGYDDVIVGAYGADSSGDTQGSAYLLLAGSFGASTTISLSDADYWFQGENDGDLSGYSVASAGDVDGDGLADLLVGGYGNDDNGASAGKTYLVLGKHLGTATTVRLYSADYFFYGEAPSDFSGYHMVGKTDVDGDGLGDLVIGAYGNDEVAAGAGAAYVVLGASLGRDEDVYLEDADHVLRGENEGDQAGVRVASGDDIDADGLDDILLGAPGNDDNGANAGKAYVVLAQSLSSSVNYLSGADYAFMGEDDEDEAGRGLALPGDIDGDGMADVAIGAYGDDYNGTNAGRAYIYFADGFDGSAAMELGDADRFFMGETAGDNAGFNIAAAGDVDRDGGADLLIAGINNDDGGSSAGKVYLILSETLSTTRVLDLSGADYAFEGEDISDKAGYGMASAGDVNADGLDDLLMGSYQNDDGGANAGKAYLFITP